MALNVPTITITRKICIDTETWAGCDCLLQSIHTVHWECMDKANTLKVFRMSSILFYCVLFWWPEQRRTKAEHRHIERQRGWGPRVKRNLQHSELCKKEDDTTTEKTQFKGNLKTCCLQGCPQMASDDIRSSDLCQQHFLHPSGHCMTVY